MKKIGYIIYAIISLLMSAACIIGILLGYAYLHY